MALQLVLGSSGAGKSYHLYKKMIEDSIVNRNTEYLVIVPEQFTMETQKDIVALHPNHGVMNLDILSFMRLAYRVFDEVGKDDRAVLEDTGKSMMIRKVVSLKKNQLTFFRANSKKPGFISELKSLLSEIYQYSVDEEKLEKMIAVSEKKPMLKGKLQDILVIYRGFQELMGEKYITAEEIFDILGDVIEKSAFIKNSVICLDGFTGFTPSQYLLLEKLMRLAKQVYVTVTIDDREDISRLDEDFKLFHLSKKTILHLYKIADHSRTHIQEPWRLKKDGKALPRFIKSPSLAALEHNLFRYPYTVYEKEQEDITIHVGKDPRQEVLFTIREVLRLVQKEGYRYRDIAVVTGDIKNYGRIIEKEYGQAGIYYFIDRKKDILSNPFVEWIRSLLEMIRNNFDYESVFRYLRSNLSDMDRDGIDLLENYVLALGIRGFKSWNRPWKRLYRKQEASELEKVNYYRELVVNQIGKVREILLLKGSSVIMLTKALYDYIMEQGMFERLEACAYGDDRTREREQIYTIVMGVLEQMVELLGEETVTLREYEELLDTGFLEAKVGLIPPGVDQIVVGDIERTRLNGVKALFFIGVNDGVVPKVSDSGGLLSDMERQMLWENKIELAPTRRQNSYTEQFYLYLNLTKPREHLYLTYCQVDWSGKQKNPSYLIGKVRKLFPKIKIRDESVEREEVSYILGADKGVEYLLKGIGRYPYEEMPTIWKELFGCYFKKEEWRKELYQYIEGAYYVTGEKGISRAAARVLYGKTLHNSVTRLELYAACAFAHFMTYGLELKERQIYQLAVPDLGNIFHKGIELVSRKMKERGFTWREITDAKRDSLAEEAVREVTEDYGNTILHSSKRNEYLIQRIERMMKRTLWALSSQLKEGKFEPLGYEVQFSPVDHLKATEMEISKEEKVYLYGRIDRLDTCNEDENVYLKVIDYKSGNTTFDLQKVYYGLQLQLVVYLNAAMELEGEKHPEKKVIPAGIFYYNIDDPIIERVSSRVSEEEVRGKLLEELKMNGLVNSDKTVLKKLDRAFEEDKSVKSKIIPVELTAKGEFGSYSQVADKKSFDALGRFAEDKIKKFGTEILEGNTEILPYQLDKRTACDYCCYSGVCKFDKKLGSYYRNLEKKNKDSIWEEINGGSEMDQGPAEGN